MSSHFLMRGEILLFRTEFNPVDMDTTETLHFRQFHFIKVAFLHLPCWLVICSLWCVEFLCTNLAKVLAIIFYLLQFECCTSILVYSGTRCKATWK